MQFKELIVGQRYMLKSPRGLVATFDGKHGSGLLALADGSHFYGGTDYLRFIAELGDERRTILLPTGADVEEAEATKLVREQQEHEKKMRQEAAMEQGVALLARLGYTVAATWHTVGPTELCIRWPAETMDELVIESMTIGKLKAMLERAKAQWPHLAALTSKEAQ